MPDIIKRKALEEQEKNRQPAKLSESVKAVKAAELRPEGKIEWVDPPKHPNRKVEIVPLPNYTGGKAETVPLPHDLSEPIRMQNMPYLIDTKPRTGAETGGTLKKPSSVSRYEDINPTAQAPKVPALFDAVSPFGKGLAKIIALSTQNPDEAKNLYQFMQTSEKDPGSSYYRPYARPTNKGAMEELSKLGIDASNIDDQWFQDNAWLKQYARLGAAGMPKVPTSQSSREETAAYYYVRLADSEGRTRQAETELQGLRREIGYWAGRKDRNYSDEEILKRIDWNKYPTLTMLREGQHKGRPAQLNRAIDFDSDTVFGMLWSARNGKTSGSSTIDAARYALGEGRQYEPDEFVRAMRDPKSYVYNPYALGSTVDETAEYFGVDGFNQKWLNDNQGILKSGNNTAIRHYQQVYDAEQLTLAAEEETRKLSDRIDARLNRAVSAGGAIDANVLLKDALFGLDTLQRMDGGLFSGDLAKLTRPVNYRWQDVANQVSGQVQVINARQNAPHNPADLGLAARNEEEKVIQGQGTLIQKDAVPKSYTSFHESMPGLWAAGLTKNPLSAGWYAPAAGVQSGFGPDHEKAQAIADSRRAGDFAAAAVQGYDALAGTGGNISKLSTHEGAVRMAIDLALDTAKAFSPEQTAIPVLQGAADRYDAAVNSILGIDPDTVAKILPQILYATTVQGDINNQAIGTAGLLSSILRLGESALKTVTDHVLGEAPTLQTVQTMFHILKLRDMETGTKSEALQAAEAALLKTAGDTLQSAAAQTGHEELDDLTSIANQSSHNLDAVMNRWGFQGVNYIDNLLKAGRGDLEAAITTMPTYAKSAIVAETNMRTFGLNDEAIAAQENALAADMKSPIVVLSAKQIAKQQAVEARKAELNAGGAFWIQSVLLQKVNDAGKTVNQSKSVLDQAVLNEQAGRVTLTKAQDIFHKNMADTAAADAVVAAIDNLQKAIDARVKAQKAFRLNQQSLNDAQQKLTETQKQATARVDEQAKQDVDAMRMKLAEARAKLMGKAVVQAGELGNVQFGRTQRLDILDAAPNSSLYLNSKFQPTINDLRNGNDQLPLQSVDLASDQFSYLANKNGSGIIKEDKPQLESDAAKVPPGKGNMPFRALAASGAVTDVGYANGNQYVKTADEEDTIKEPGIDDLLNAVMTPKQRGQRAEITSLILGMLSNEQKRRMESGEDIFTIINELDSWQKDRIKTSINKLEALNLQQQRDLMFLRGGDLEDKPLAERLVILQFLKQEKEEGIFTADELMGLAASFLGKEIKGGLFEELNHNPPVKALVEEFANVMGKSYQITRFGETLESANAQYIAQNQAAGTTMATAMFAGAASAAVDKLLYGPASISLDPNKRLESTELQGTTEGSKGSQFSWNLPEETSQKYYAAKSAGWKNKDGATWWPDNNGFEDTPTKTTLQPGKRIDRYGNEKGRFASPEGTPFDQRSLAPGSENSPYNSYEVIEPFDVNSGIAAPWFDQPGGGTQYQLPMSIQELLDSGYIRIITK